ncbi:MAG: aspartate--tRNA ligase [Bacteroidetes bacterium]|nr:aspartate--tRNA ligase [Bacteroidota bacterium]MBU2585019.1 aspartate--tRNA ligase [Bacteroidota bacterium]
MNYIKRTHTCGELREKNIGEKITLNGWVDVRRDLGGVIFIDLRDRYGITQIVFEPHYNETAHNNAKDVRSEWVLSVTGTVRKRPEGTENPELETGLIDVMIDEITILNKAITPPFQIQDELDANEDLRLKYRYLDLRRKPMQKNLLLRHKMYQIVRNYFDKNSFVEIETPFLMKSTPEGARDFLVPSRIHKGHFYALPQSPQTYKQLLMVSGFDRYFQIVKCFRDEDLRADRQYEFTQIDVEMSFVDEENVFEMMEGLMKELFLQTSNFNLQTPFLRLSYKEAMETYGSDKPDLRFELKMTSLNELLKTSGFKVFSDTINKGGTVSGLNAVGCGNYTRNQLDVLTDYVKKLGAGGLIWIRVTDNGLDSPTMKFLSDEEKQSITKALNAKPGDLLLLISGEWKKALTIMGNLRLEMARRMELLKNNSEPKLLWITDFPLFEYSEADKRLVAMHHPFTSPKDSDIELMETEPQKVHAKAYDLVMNGNEIAGGSIRIFSPELQSKMFTALGLSKEEAEEKFGFLMNAFKYGAPPHGGIAFGFDRMVMLFAGESSIREVIAFPKTSSGLSLMDGSPSAASEEQLKELHIKVKGGD